MIFGGKVFPEILLFTFLVCLASAASQEELDQSVMDSAENCDTGEMERLINAGANIHATNQLGETVLLHALGHPECMTFVIKKGVSVDARIGHFQTENDQATSLMMASGTDDPESVPVLIDAGADVNARNITGKTPIMFAAENAAIKTIGLLLAGGADINQRDLRGRTALMLAACSGENSAEVVQFLMNKSADIDARDRRGKSASFYAAGEGENLPMFQILQQAGAIDATPELLNALRQKITIANMRTLAAGIETFSTKGYPLSSDGNPPTLDLNSSAYMDGWGNKLKYFCFKPDGHYWIISFGADGTKDQTYSSDRFTPRKSGLVVSAKSDLVFSSGSLLTWPETQGDPGNPTDQICDPF